MKNSQRFVHWKQPKFNRLGMTKWQWMCQNRKNLTIDSGADIGAFTYINAKHGVFIGEDVQIGSHCSIYSESTIDNKRGPVKIESGARIGSHTTIMPNITIGKNAIIGAHSFVNKNIPAGKIAFGVHIKIQK